MVENENLLKRLDAFLSKYGFARNLAFTSIVVGMALLSKGYLSGDHNVIRYAVTLLVAGVLLFYRYLKFFRQYSYELFNTYAGGR